jgi:hypothetical protein
MSILDGKVVVNVFLERMGGTFFTNPIQNRLKSISGVVVDFVDSAKKADFVIHSEYSFYEYELELFDHGHIEIDHWHVIIFDNNGSFHAPRRSCLLANIFMFTEKEFWQDNGCEVFIKMIHTQLERRKICQFKEQN